jgi:hypothetical protein
VSNINAVESLSLNTSLQTLLLNHILLAAQDADTHRAWELNVSSQDDIPSTAHVIAFLEQRCKALELLQTRQQTTIPASTTSKHSTPVAISKHISSSGNKVSQTARTYVTSKFQCSLCKDSHLLSYCDKFIKYSPKQRMEFVRTSKLCYNCLRQYSKNHAFSSQHCKQCNKRHHTLLHGAVNN